jgi:hypothetical protein
VALRMAQDAHDPATAGSSYVLRTGAGRHVIRYN